jgi:CubicO group peptidase (beta-lactamase class C family)
MKKIWCIGCIVLLCVTGCHKRQARLSWKVAEIAGCWKGRMVSPHDHPFSEMILFSHRPDSTLALSLFFELGPRSMVHSFDQDVEVRERTVHWKNNDGFLSSNRDTLHVTRTESWGQSTWLFTRDKSADALMVQLHENPEVPYTYRIPEDRDDGWHGEDIAASGMGKSKVIELINEIRDGKHDDIHSFLIVKDHSLVVEEYFAENGTKHGPFITGLFRDKVHHLASTTKCVTSTLVGIAIDKGFIRDAEEPIQAYLPVYSSLFTGEKKSISIRDMLTMTPGFEWRQFGVSDDLNDGMRMWGTDDVIGYVLRKPLEARPGKKFNYSNGVPTVVGAIIRNAIGMEVGVFAERYLFDSLGIQEYVWTCYPDGSIETDGGLALRSRDLAKIGQLFLDHGTWNGKVIVSEDWVLESTRERLRFGRSGRWGYGYYWMQAEWRVDDRVVRSFFAPGDGNQILAVFPGLKMVVVFTAGNYGRDPKSTYHSLFEEFILPAVLQRK